MNPVEMAKGLFFEGLKFLESGDMVSAENFFSQALELVPERPSILVNLSAAKLRLKKFVEAEDLARRAVKADAKSSEAWANLGDVLAATERHHEAVQAYDLALDGNPAYSQALQNKASALLALGRNEEALAACTRALEIAPKQVEVLRVRSQALRVLKREDEARAEYVEYLRAASANAPIYRTARAAGQRAEILILVPEPNLGDELPPLDFLYRVTGNYPTQLADRLAGEFHFNFIFQSDVAPLKNSRQFFSADVVINNYGNGDLIQIEGNLPQLTEAAESFNTPIINHPAKVFQTAREKMVQLLQDVPGVVVPKTRRFFARGKTADEMARLIEANFDYPLITRTLMAQRGIGMTRFESRAELMQKLALGFPDEFYVTQFVDSRTPEGFARKIRVSIVGDEMVVTRVDSSPEWNVHGRKPPHRVKFYLDHPHLLAEEKRICADPEKELGQPAMRSLRAMRERIPLDVFGIDFNVLDDGRVLFYEANACMNLLSTASEKVPFPKQPDERLLEIFRNYLAKRAAGN